MALRSNRCIDLFVVALIGAACACTAPDFSTTNGSDKALSNGDCPDEYCGANSPKVDVMGFHELHLGGLPNAQGMRIVGAFLHGERASISVRQGRLAADVKGVRISGVALVGLEVRLLTNERATTLEIVEVRQMQFPVPQGTQDVAETYVIEYVSGGVRKNLCGARSVPDPVAAEAFGQSPREALLFEGDRINTATMTIHPVADRAWFNIGCAGHTLSKLHLTRHTKASGGYALGRTWQENQAVLKLLVADYCGTGRPFTVAGQPLAWHDPAQLVTPFPIVTTLDARWNELGATCIGEPRMTAPATAEGSQLFPDIWSQIEQECRSVARALPLCDKPDINNFAGALRVSANRDY